MVALVLQGGGALGLYQAGVYQGLAEAQLHPNWVAGISIGALNAAIIAGNPAQRRVERLYEFWQTICRPPLLPSSPLSQMDLRDWPSPLIGLFNGWEAWRALTEGQNGFFRSRAHFSLDHSATPDTTSYYDTAPLKVQPHRDGRGDRRRRRSRHRSAGDARRDRAGLAGVRFRDGAACLRRNCVRARAR